MHAYILYVIFLGPLISEDLCIKESYTLAPDQLYSVL